MNYSIIFRLLSVILFTLSAAFAISLGVGYPYRFHGSEQGALIGFGFSIVIALGISLAFYILGREGEMKLFRKEALCIVGMGWILASLIGALPYFLILPGCSFVDAVFESASGLTTTGASVFSDLENLPKSLLFWRALSQWIGGLGVVVFFVAILSFLGAGAKVLFFQESSTQSMDLDSHRIQNGVLGILWVYLGLSGACAISYRLVGLSWYDAFCHMFATVSTGGFSTRSASIAAFQSPLFEWAVILFMALGGTSIILMLRMIKKDWNFLSVNTELRGYYGVIAGASLLIAGVRYFQPLAADIRTIFRESVFQVISIMTTTGFGTADFDLWVPATHVFLLALMVVGGSSGSTAGGIKVIRLLLGIKLCLRNIERAFRTRVVRSIKINGKPVEPSSYQDVATFLVLIAGVGFLSVMLVSLLEPHTSFEGSFSATLACLFNIGPGFSEVGPTRNYSYLHDVTKLFLSLIMIMGRLELYAILVLFAPSLWKRFS